MNDYTIPDLIASRGEEIYLDELKEKLEKTNNGDYVVIEVQSKKYFVNSDLKDALLEAEQKFPDKIFHIVRIGSFQKLSKGNPHVVNKNAWLF